MIKARLCVGGWCTGIGMMGLVDFVGHGDIVGIVLTGSSLFWGIGLIFANWDAVADIRLPGPASAEKTEETK